MTNHDHLTADQYEDLIVRYATTVAATTTKRVGRKTLNTFAAYEVWDEVRDDAYDLLIRRGGECLVDEMLAEVTDEASARMLETIEDLRRNA
jgi:hypothetical protein